MPRKKGKLAKAVLINLLKKGVIVLDGHAPYRWASFYFKIFSGEKIFKNSHKDTFSNLKRKGLIEIKKKNNRFSMSLTEEGEIEADKYQINEMHIKKQRKWDKKWRIIIFDIPEKRRIKRDLFRSKLKEMGFVQFQKSVWAYPFPCEKEINLLRDFFGLEKRNLIVLTVEKMDDGGFLKGKFNLL